MSPNGAEIVGTYENLHGCAFANVWQNEDGTLGLEYAGETEIDWDGQETQTNEHGVTMWVCTEGLVWPEDQLTFVPDTAPD